MKTKIRSLIAIIALGTIGITNINAISDHKHLLNAEFDNGQDQQLSIESWMINESNWTSEAIFTNADAEESLEMESWMTNESLWTPSDEVDTLVSEKALQVESWMISESIWE